MPRQIPRVPQVSHHKASGQAVVRLGGHDFYLGPWDTPEAKAEYDRIVAEWLVGGRRPQGSDGVDEVTVVEIIAGFWEHAKTYYRQPDGTPSSELKNLRDALRPLRRLYGHTPAAQFGPLALKAVRQAMITQGLCRTSINRRVGRLKHVFKWAAENELVPPAVYHGLQAVAGLKAGRSDARESAPVRPVPEDHVRAVLPHVSRQVGAMIRLQLLTGMRPGEVVAVRGIDLDTTGRVWTYRPQRHKTLHMGHERTVYLGPRRRRSSARSSIPTPRPTCSRRPKPRPSGGRRRTPNARHRRPAGTRRGATCGRCRSVSPATATP